MVDFVLFLKNNDWHYALRHTVLVEQEHEVFRRTFRSIHHLIRILGVAQQISAHSKVEKLMYIANCSRRANSSDPRDKVYAPLALVNAKLEDDLGFVPDYNKSIQEVFRDFTLFLMDRSQSYDVLVVTQPSSRPMPNLPSWVLDMSLPGSDWFTETQRAWKASDGWVYLPRE